MLLITLSDGTSLENISTVFSVPFSLSSGWLPLFSCFFSSTPLSFSDDLFASSFLSSIASDFSLTDASADTLAFLFTADCCILIILGIAITDDDSVITAINAATAIHLFFFNL